ncbi:MAG: ribonucleotide-diphosphate reductase subunit beta [Candidatus Omnitrophica bacterium CG11_big_fil_rev_8_21_14_0_20_63_9]|nr:MAG: ribonucleotide-diphosphate reductase subunit beta [Candidatus Omnitrophica bacterium CG11_big_fil_rev_8_21_14_0_20_63_9]
MGDIIAMTATRVRADDKRIINNKAVDVNQLIPIKYAWAWQYYLDACANHWMPQEISMQRDIEQWRNPKAFTDDERLAVKRALGFFSTAETIVANNVIMAIYKFITAPECRMYILRQAFEEAIHTHAYGQYMPESLGMDTGELMNMYREVPAIHDKEEFGARLTVDILQPDFETESFSGRSRLLRNLIGYYVVTEGIFFYTTFVMLLSFGRQNRLPGVCEQVQYILRDESMHLNFGLELIHAFIRENQDVWTEEAKAWALEAVKEGVRLEYRHAEDSLPNGLLGLTHQMMKQYVEYIADRRLERLGLPKPYGTSNPFPWMSEVIDLRKEKNFFETRVTEYQTGGTLSWE